MSESVVPDSDKEKTDREVPFLTACAKALDRIGPRIRYDLEPPDPETHRQQYILRIYRKVSGGQMSFSSFDTHSRRWYPERIDKPYLYKEYKPCDVDSANPFGYEAVTLPYTEWFNVTEDGLVFIGDESVLEIMRDKQPFEIEQREELRIEQPQELAEFVEFYITATQEELSEVDFFREDKVKECTLSSIFSGLHVVVRIGKGRLIFDLTKPGVLQNLTAEFKSLIEVKLALFKGILPPFLDVWAKATLQKMRIEGRLRSESVLEQLAKSLGKLGLERLPSVGFLYRAEDELDMKSGFFPVKPRQWLFEPDIADELSVEGLSFRPNLKHSSVLFLHEYFTYTEEGKKAIAEISNCKTIEEMINKFTTLRVRIPGQVRQQIRFAIELREIRRCLESDVADLMQAREPVEQVLECTWRRLNQVSILKSSFQQENDSTLHPLPYFIEKAYRNFVRADPGREKADIGVSCAAQIYKVMTCFVLEEFEHNWPKAGRRRPQRLEQLIAEVDSGKPSDGTWLNLFKVLFEEGHECISIMLAVGQKYYDNIAKAFELVAARNKSRHAHETSRRAYAADTQQLTSKVTETLPLIIDALREGFKGIELLIPLKSSFDREKGQVFEARRAMGYESDFIIVEKTLAEGMEHYVDKQLILYSGNKFFPLRKYFQCEEEMHGYFKIDLKI